MSFLSKLGKILAGAGMAAAVPLTGGASLTALPTLLAAGAGGLSALGGGMGAAGEAIGKATTASGNNRLEQEKLALEAQRSNTLGQSEFERQLLARQQAEDTQRQTARKDSYRASVAANPMAGPYNPRPQVLSPQFTADMANVGTHASSRLANPAKHTVAEMPELSPYVPLDIQNLQEATGTEKGGLEKFGDWAGPISSVISQLMKRFGATADSADTPSYMDKNMYAK